MKIENSRPHRIWTIGSARTDSNTYGGRLAAYPEGWRDMQADCPIDDFQIYWKRCEDAERERVRKRRGRIWTYEKAEALANRCRSVDEFRKKHPNAYRAAMRYDWTPYLFPVKFVIGE